MEQYSILVVDDDREIVRSLGKLLELEGYRVLTAFNGMDALDRLESDTVHLILLDVMMPQLNGLSALMRIRQEHNIPVIILSARTEESDKVSGLTMGADDYVTKPYNTAEQIYSRVWQEDAYAGEKTVMVHIRRIREKIEITPKNPKYLKVVWEIGYKIEKYD